MGTALDPSSAAIAARLCWGVIGSGLEETAAVLLERRCAGLGIKTLRLSATGALPVPQLSKKTLFSGGTAVFSLEAGAELAVRPEDLAVIAAAPIKESFLRTVKTTEGPSSQEKALRFGIMAVTGLPIGLGKTKEVTKEVAGSELSFYMDLVLRGSSARLRLASGNFDFSGLKEKKTYSSQVNFRVLCAELAAFAPGEGAFEEANGAFVEHQNQLAGRRGLGGDCSVRPERGGSSHNSICGKRTGGA